MDARRAVIRPATPYLQMTGDRGASEASGAGWGNRRQPLSAPPHQVFRKARPLVVAAERQHGDEQVYGVATPSPVKWRRLLHQLVDSSEYTWSGSV